jgi:ATP-dependent helicase HrpB
VVRRLWDARDRLRPHREPEIHRIDLSSTALDVIAWGGDPRALEWFERPRQDALDAALALLARLGLVEAGGARSGIHLTLLGEQVRHLPLHPRLARMLVAANGARPMARACALLSERHLLPARTASTTSDLLSAIDSWHTVPPNVQRVADQIADFGLRIADSESTLQSAIRNPQSAMTDESGFLRAVLAGYPDRVAQRREPGSPNVKLASGAGAVLGRESGVLDGEFLVALDVSRQSAIHKSQSAIVRIASRVEREWLTPTSSEAVHRFDNESGTVKAAMLERYDELVLAERPIAADPEIAAGLLAEAWLARPPRDEDERLLRRLRFAGQSLELDGLVRAAACGARSLDDMELARMLPPEVARAIDRDAPETLAVPSGRRVRLEYHDDGTVAAHVKLQELFGLAETPRIGRQREPIVLSLLAPNGRPVQVTRDLRSFWDRTYPEVRKELRGRYPRHPWPADPWNATPTARTKRTSSFKRSE